LACVTNGGRVNEEVQPQPGCCTTLLPAPAFTHAGAISFHSRQIIEIIDAVALCDRRQRLAGIAALDGLGAPSRRSGPPCCMKSDVRRIFISVRNDDNPKIALSSHKSGN
jgi:hypothetical protein